MFRRLGVFTGPFPLDAAEAVCGDAGDAGWAVFDVLSRLVDKSLVVHDPDTGWYRLLETIRLYALDRCRDAGELEATRDRHATWWAGWLDAHHPDGPSDGDLDAIHHAYPNLRVALQWAAATQPDLALELAGGLGIYWYLRGLLGDAVTLGDLALASSAERGPAWARAVGRMAMPRYYANDDALHDRRRRRSLRHRRRLGRPAHPAALPGDAGADHRGPARSSGSWPGRAEACGDLWVGRAHAHRASPSGASSSASPMHRSRSSALAAIAEQLDASSFRFAAAPRRGRAARRRTPASGRPSLGWSRPWPSPTGPRPLQAHGVRQPRLATASSVASRRRSSGWPACWPARRATGEP